MQMRCLHWFTLDKRFFIQNQSDGFSLKKKKPTKQTLSTLDFFLQNKTMSNGMASGRESRLPPMNELAEMAAKKTTTAMTRFVGERLSRRLSK